ncbi:ornithine carbamoyltransferase [Candidatus Pacearchaeota archaeon CG10_big_fil_rev_8_21_14_0_10_35_219]|nr:ornithine carbamoyltransferase [Candidatus Pacearchaeota archaeon]OIO43349.1 MAG: ornithine carbamoyltransferase [Candidatus Pacearchaeota archaeon CG1_02_35_32]PIO07721.1 MAG: ornithine carbamoyltransferase [Candidatus Pacearchaeota archaeon CG10_big_fil_rev_8_21_14_0_10_35_219]PIY81497.1 MAG: ornithine carbamoyltransferase [Candidatus Pacearchaeota archaeon CG_4_10_14_0_8_um_filter_35_169]PIZ80417.1 MAG: ornithine carbamoyltransferase [Candidatus Pacearchaeota archaeon CG_4_10_14_0_2_um_fi
MKKRDLLSLEDWKKSDISDVIIRAEKLKRNRKTVNVLNGKTLLMLFAKPSLRTYLSFDIAMYQLGGHAIFYDLSHSTLGKKESIKDFSKVIARYSDVIMARLYEHKQIEEIAKYADVPVINGLTNYYHPCQVLGDFLTIKEKLGGFQKKKIAFLGDANNNVVHSLILEGNRTGTEIIISSPDKKEYLPNPKVIAKGKYKYIKDPKKAVKDADVIYTDTWMSYQVPKSQEKKRIKMLKPYQVNGKIFNINKKAIFMHCLPAKRGHEVTDDVIDSKRSVVYQQAENRMWSEKAVLLKCLGVKT